MAIVVSDSSFLIPLLDPQVKGIGKVDAKLQHLIATMDKQKKSSSSQRPRSAKR